MFFAFTSWSFLLLFDNGQIVSTTLNTKFLDLRLSYWLGYFVPVCIAANFFLNFCYFLLWPELILLPASALKRSKLSRKKDYVRDRIPCEEHGMHFIEAQNNFFTFFPRRAAFFNQNHVSDRITYLENDPKIFFYLPDYFFIYFLKNTFKR